MSAFLWIVAALVVIYLGYEFARVRALSKISALLVNESRPYERIGGRISMLVIGDSTAAGVGADMPEDSVPGRVSALLDASVENRAVSGAVVSEISEQLNQAKGSHYDVILIQAGANDVVGLKSLDAASNQMDALLQKAHAMSDRVILLTAGRIGDAPLLPRIAGPLFNRRANILRAKFMQLAAKDDAQYIDLAGAASDPFNTDPQKYYAADMFHPSSDGYALWFQEVKKVIDANWPDLEHGAN